MAVAGWYPDDSGMLRYWDGEQWTEHVQPMEQEEAASVEVLEAEQTVSGFAFEAAQTASGGAEVARAAVVQSSTLSQPHGAQVPLTHQDASGQVGTQVFVGGVATTKPTNGVGVAGFVSALVALFVSWIPFVGWVVWILGLILSAVGVFKKPKGLAIAGLVISLLGLIILVVVLGGIMAAVGMSSM